MLAHILSWKCFRKLFSKPSDIYIYISIISTVFSFVLFLVHPFSLIMRKPMRSFLVTVQQTVGEREKKDGMGVSIEKKTINIDVKCHFNLNDVKSAS